MIRLLKCEFMKTRRRYIFLTVLAMTALAGVWAFHSKYSGESGSFLLKNGYMMVLYQFPLINAIFFPLLSVIIASRLCDIEHKGANFKQICTQTDKSRIFNVKLIYGLALVLSGVLLFWVATLIYGKIMHFGGQIPIKLYLLYLLSTIAPTAAIYTFQHSLSMIFKNQAVPFFVGILGEFAGLFSMFLSQIPMFRKSIIWGYYGALQFVGMFGWTKETRYSAAYFEVMGFDWTAFAVLIIMTALIYIIGRKIFCEKEI